jgi:hypothetical protein
MTSTLTTTTTKTYNNALLTQYINNVHLAPAMIAAGLPPQCTGMGSKGLPGRGYYALMSRKKLAHKLEADASAGAHNQPGGAVLIGVQDVGYLIHRYCGWRRGDRGCFWWDGVNRGRRYFAMQQSDVLAGPALSRVVGGRKPRCTADGG